VSPQSNDVDSVVKIVVSILTLLKAQKEWKKFNENILLISKRRGQHKKGVSAAVGEGMKLVEELKAKPEDEATLLELIDVLRTVTDGKIFIELERARVTMTWSKIMEKNGNLKKACTTLNDIQIETYGSMERREKAEYVLEQMRLLLDNNDLIRANMVAKKLSDKVLNDKDFEDIKIEYNMHMVRYHTEKANYMSLFNCYNNILSTEITKNDPEKLLNTLQTTVGFLALSPRDPEQIDHCLRLKEEEAMEKLPACAQLLKKLLTKELGRWSDVESTLKGEIFGKGAFVGERAETRWDDLHKRFIEHNIYVVSENYCRVSVKRLSELLEMPEDKTESFLCDMVSRKHLYGKIDRPAGVVVFKKNASAEDLLNDWSNDITSLLNLVEKSCHLIYKENVAHKLLK